MSSVKTAELTNLALDYAVILAMFPKAFEGKPSIKAIVLNYPCRKDWKMAGPIIEGEKIQLFKQVGPDWTAQAWVGKLRVSGPTPLIAVWRCFVASKLGDTVEIPQELLT